MTDTLRGILIDARDKSITEVEVEKYPKWKETIESDDINAVNLIRNDDTGLIETLWVDGEGLLNDKQHGPWFRVEQHPQPMAVIGLILGTDGVGETVSTELSVSDVEKFVTWPNVRFMGLEPIEPHEEVHPMLGKVMVTGSVAQFEADTEAAADAEDNKSD